IVSSEAGSITLRHESEGGTSCLSLKRRECRWDRRRPCSSSVHEDRGRDDRRRGVRYICVERLEDQGICSFQNPELRKGSSCPFQGLLIDFHRDTGTADPIFGLEDKLPTPLT
ncbi:uncharacterized protein MYCFIDRAFT_44967, partial [Pseudocercospora fijiensis CIRAD86]